MYAMPSPGHALLPAKEEPVVTVLGYGILGGLAFLILPRLLLYICSFTCRGVKKSSQSSNWNGILGVVEAGSNFARVQSTGAGGTQGGIKTGLFLFGCYFTIVLILIRDLRQLLEADKDYNSTILGPTNLTGFVIQ